MSKNQKKRMIKQQEKADVKVEVQKKAEVKIEGVKKVVAQVQTPKKTPSKSVDLTKVEEVIKLGKNAKRKL